VTRDVFVTGNVSVTGTKSAAVPHPDGTHRASYALESPETWFEDFGRGELVEGQVRIDLDTDFAAVVKTEDDYHVFLTPEGDSRGLYVSSRSPTGFEVREQQEGTSTLPFSYRVVAKRKDIDAERMAEVEVPQPIEREEPLEEPGVQQPEGVPPPPLGWPVEELGWPPESAPEQPEGVASPPPGWPVEALGWPPAPAQGRPTSEPSREQQPPRPPAGEETQQ
jgi:hypothetical protein